ncbi:CapA family protein [Arthrobacter sp. zg-Y820]|uniref:CapA family protein n=1 Tax=unclassified Arthrobacter TaxID=235627 RepID=UPI001E5682AE|nr:MULTISPECIES: CapA family protein [unclassified Arthrobacter]MCC9196391.1 CapA family protein [Arthrobacter sp. zg-Y820]MDK1279253.1 CapA family protein [Arthrobacter sp. zg.Y820]WIB08350.1 CapA family protein [Arthrobacter sp. zg-Y820]
MGARRFGFTAVLLLVLAAGCSPGTSDPVPSEPAQSSEPRISSDAATGTAAPSPAAVPEPTPGLGAGCAAVRCFSMMLAGDLLVHPQLWAQAETDAAASGRKPLDFRPLLEGKRAYLDRADLGICHMETPVAEAQGPYAGYPLFNVPPQILSAAQDVGYDACTTASNHTVDAGTAGLNRTLAELDALGLEHTGSYASEADAAKPMILEAPAAKVSVIEATYGLNGMSAEFDWQVDLLDPADMIARAQAARAAGADVVVGAVHAGDEYASVPNAQQIETAHALADSGEFDFIYGHHSHSVLPIENYNGTWIAYGLGNAVTELSPWYDVNNEGLILRAQFGQDDVGGWSVTDLAWAPSVIVSDPYRWCSVAADRPQGACASESQAAAVRARTIGVVESMGAAEAGAREWLVSAEPAP